MSTAQQRNEIDKQVDNFPLFIKTECNDLIDYRIEYPDEFDYHYGLPDDEFNYKSEKVCDNVCMIYLPQLLKLLKELNIDEERLQQIIKQFKQATQLEKHLGSPVGDLIEGIRQCQCNQ